MHILVVGLNYKTAPVHVRERFTFASDEMSEALRQLKRTKSILECVVVATCNRTELYAVVDRLHLCGHFIRNFLEEWFDIPREEFTHHLYIKEDQSALNHLFRVTSGLDSMVIGETQILGQVRDAFLLAQKEKTTGTLFNTLFKQAITMAKRAHSETSIGENAVSVSYAAVELGKQIYGDLVGKCVVIIGAGKMSELTAKHLHANGVSEVIVMNRTIERARDLAKKFYGTACSMEDLPEVLQRADIIISSTGSKDYVLSADTLRQAMPGRKSSDTLFMIDIAVPRDIDPNISKIDNVFLYDIDDLEGIVQNNVEQRMQEAAKIELMIEREISDFNHWYKTLGVGPVIRALQEKSSSVHKEIMEDLFNKLPDLTERESKVIRKLTKSIVNQMMHDPINRIKEMSAERNGQEALEMFTQFFALEERVKQLEEEARLFRRVELEQKREAPKPKQKNTHVAGVSVAASELLVRS